MRRTILTILCILALLMAAAPPASAGEEPVETSTFLSITSPKQYETVWSDLVPPEVTVVGRAEPRTGYGTSWSRAAQVWSRAGTRPTSPAPSRSRKATRRSP
ncbi:hypothetical protein [Methanoculleus chikugoensis]|uniref:hypothetical protein n=1 Tax=Methanoculleus chikugoensis TaxID=118126 RepID=UPI001FB55221|nr:hypothetical protein [Methanoculleus chikugoensis]